MTYAITLEHGSDGSYLAWVDELPGCFARGATREEALDNCSTAIADFREWLRTIGESVESGDVAVVVTSESNAVVETDEDTEVLLEVDRESLSERDWRTLERWLAASREALLDSLDKLADEQLDQRIEGRDRTVREQVIHIAFVELMYAAWTFDLRARTGIEEFLAWTRDITLQRMVLLALEDDSSVTHAEWAGAPGHESWTARKAARRLVWHERLHLPEISGPLERQPTG